MNTSVTVIWSGHVWSFLSQKLATDTRINQISARKIGWVSWILSGQIADRIIRILSHQETVRSLVERLQNNEPVIFAGRNGLLLNQVIQSIKRDCPEKINNFYIFWVNGFQLYDDVPRIVLDHAIKDSQVIHGKSPVPFTSDGKSYLYQPNPSVFDKQLIRELDFDIEITSDKNVFLKALYLKGCMNTIYNSMCISNGPYIESAMNYFLSDFLDTCISELYQIINHLSPGLLSEEEISKEAYFLKQAVPHAKPSSHDQFWTRKYGRIVADYENSDISLLLAWVLRYAQANAIETPSLLELMEDIVWKGNRHNGAHVWPDGKHLHLREDGTRNRTWFAQPIGVGEDRGLEYVWIDTGVH